jgi:anti-sigma regulatory factor (Ser/Thr protein kinase)/biotin operon repressor
MTTKDLAKKILAKEGKLKPKTLADRAKVSRQQASKTIKRLKEEGKVIRVGKGPKTAYISPESDQFDDKIFKKEFTTSNSQEDKVVSEAKLSNAFLKRLPQNTEEIFDYAFSEMINNAIEHSQSQKIKVKVGKEEDFLTFTVRDFGIGVFENIKKKKNLNSQTEAIQDLLKGKTTTMPKAHSGEGIFFTSKVADVFVLESFDYKLQVDNLLEDVFVAKINDQLEGTKVIFRIKKDTDKKLENIFKDYQAVETEFGFDKTEITVKLYENDINYVSRSQARRILVGLDKFKKIILDFKDISGIGQAFADEIFRVFKERHPDITIEFKNANEAIEMMIKRVK